MAQHPLQNALPSQCVSTPLDVGLSLLCLVGALLSVQRGFIGRYPLHFHKMGDCPECQFIGNAVVGSTQRGIVIHSTHRSTVLKNVVFGVKGAYIYVEEGVEIDNTIQVKKSHCVFAWSGKSGQSTAGYDTGLWNIGRPLPATLGAATAAFVAGERPRM